LNNLRRANNNNSIELFNIFVKEFAFLNNTKREISNSISVKIENLNNIVKKKNNKQET